MLFQLLALLLHAPRRFFSAYLSQIHRARSEHALPDIPDAPLAVLLAPQVLEVPPVPLLDAEVHVLRARKSGILHAPRPLLLAPRARKGRVQRGEERLRVGKGFGSAEGRAALTDERRGG